MFRLLNDNKLSKSTNQQSKSLFKSNNALTTISGTSELAKYLSEKAEK